MYPKEYLAYLAHFHGDRDYFECHELLEAYWKSLPQPMRSAVWVGLIQIAVSLYHQRRGNFSGAAKMMRSAVEILAQTAKEVERLGLDSKELHTRLSARLSEIEQGKPYTSFNLPIADPALKSECEQLCRQCGFRFGQASDLTDDYLLNKHTRRDRSDVIAEREKSLQAKRANRGGA
jgi:predicted metal-dependent hydrolase